MTPLAAELPTCNPAELIRGLGLWVHDHPREALELLPEWRGLAAALAAL